MEHAEHDADRGFGFRGAGGVDARVVLQAQDLRVVEVVETHFQQAIGLELKLLQVEFQLCDHIGRELRVFDFQDTPCDGFAGRIEEGLRCVGEHGADAIEQQGIRAAVGEDAVELECAVIALESGDQRLHFTTDATEFGHAD